jgi:hypothetical protein
LLVGSPIVELPIVGLLIGVSSRRRHDCLPDKSRRRMFTVCS